MPVVRDCSLDSVPVECNPSYNFDHIPAAVHSPAAEVVRHSLAVAGNHSVIRDSVVVVAHRDFRSCLVVVAHRDFHSCSVAVNHRDSRSCLVAVAVPVFRNRSSPA